MSKYNIPYALDPNAHLRSKDKNVHYFRTHLMMPIYEVILIVSLVLHFVHQQMHVTQCTSNLDYDQTSQWSWFTTSPLAIIDQG